MKTITENRLDFIKNNNVIVKVNNYDEARKITAIISEKAASLPLWALLNIVKTDFSKYYLLHLVKEKQIILTTEYKKWDKSKTIIHEFPTKNFINAFN